MSTVVVRLVGICVWIRAFVLRRLMLMRAFMVQISEIRLFWLNGMMVLMVIAGLGNTLLRWLSSILRFRLARVEILNELGSLCWTVDRALGLVALVPPMIISLVVLSLCDLCTVLCMVVNRLKGLGLALLSMTSIRLFVSILLRADPNVLISLRGRRWMNLMALAIAKCSLAGAWFR